MKFKCSVLIIVMALSLGFFMIRVFENYDYNPAVLKYEWGKINITLSGTPRDIKGERRTVKGTPYDLILGFYLNNYAINQIALKRLYLINAANEQRVFSVQEEYVKSVEYSNNTYRTFFSFYKLDLAYGDFWLDIEFKCAGEIYTERVLIKRNYNENKSNDVVDVILSV